MFPNFIAFDVETTGLNSQKNEIIELAGVKFTFENEAEVLGVKVLDTFEQFVKPDVQISEEITRINHITNEMVEDAPSIDLVLNKFKRFCGLSTILVAHNAMFDIGFLNIAFKKTGIPIVSNPILDSLKIIKRIRPDITSYKLDSLVKLFHSELDVQFDSKSFHRALYDCQMLAAVFTHSVSSYFEINDLLFHNFIPNLARKAHGVPMKIKVS